MSEILDEGRKTLIAMKLGLYCYLMDKDYVDKESMPLIKALNLLEQYEQKEKGVKLTHTTRNQQEYYYCKCDNEVGICEDDGTWYIKEKYCSECGTKIDWSDIDES